MRYLLTATFVAASLISTIGQAQWGDLKVQFKYDGKAPKPAPVNVTVDKEFCGKHDLKDERLVVGEEGGIANVILYAYDGRGGKKIPSVHPDLKASKTLELANKDCRFEPHIVITQVGDTLNVTNPDPVGHNCNLPFLANKPVNFTIPPGKAEKVQLELPEPAPIPAACNIHPWMNAKVVVLEHPYAAKSDETGTLIIKNLPVGELAFRLNHEAAGKLSGLNIGGEKLDRRNVFELEIKPGMNDLGTVVLSADLFE